MSRSKWKGVYLNSRILHYRENKMLNLFRVWSRASVIPKFLVNKKVGIYTGKYFKRVWISIDKIGLKFGEFADTRIHTKHVSRKNLKKK